MPKAEAPNQRRTDPERKPAKLSKIRPQPCAMGRLQISRFEG